MTYLNALDALKIRLIYLLYVQGGGAILNIVFVARTEP